MKKEDIRIHWDEQGDYLEINFKEPTKSYYEEVGDEILIRRDEKTGQVKGYSIFFATNREKKKKEKVSVTSEQTSQATT